MVVLAGSIVVESCLKVEGAEPATADVVVSATRVSTDIDTVASSISVITDNDIAHRQTRTLSEVLSGVPGVHVSRNGALGKGVNVFMRGAKSDHILVLIDGVEINDPMGPGRGASIADIGVDNIEKIEVLRGPQSALYGSDALGGVVNIITRKGKGARGITLSAEAGSFETYRESAELQGVLDDIDYSFSLSRVDSAGISMASEKNGNTEKDGYWNNTFSAKLGWNPAEDFGLSLVLRYIDSESDLDSGVEDTLDYVAATEQMFVRSEADIWLLDSLWQQKIGVSYSTIERLYDQPADRSSFDSELLKSDWQNNVFLTDSHIVTLGAEYEKEQGQSSTVGTYSSEFARKSAEMAGVYLQDGMTLKEVLSVSASARLDHHDSFGDEFTYRLAPVYEVSKTGTRFKGTYGTGFKAPSLYQLYSPYGSEDLKPVRNESFDVGVSQDLFSDKLVFDVVYFENQFEDMISYDYATSLYGNISEAESKGFEVIASLKADEDITLNVSYTFTDAKDKDTGEALKRVPEDRVALNASYTPGKVSANIGVVYVGARRDMDFSADQSITLTSYVMVDLAASYDFTDAVQVFGRVENLLDEDYEEVYGYGTPGLGVYGGVKIKL